MIRAAYVVMVLLLAALPACSSGRGEIRINVAYRELPAWMQMPRSIGGYSLFAAIAGPSLATGEIGP